MSLEAEILVEQERLYIVPMITNRRHELIYGIYYSEDGPLKDVDTPQFIIQEGIKTSLIPAKVTLIVKTISTKMRVKFL